MSLVNEALRKARLEAARQEADRTGAILPTLGQVRRESQRESTSPGTAVLIALGIGALLALLFFKFAWSPGPDLEGDGEAAVVQPPMAVSRSANAGPAGAEPTLNDETSELRAADSPSGQPEVRPMSPPVEPGSYEISTGAIQKGSEPASLPGSGSGTVADAQPAASAAGRPARLEADPQPRRPQPEEARAVAQHDARPPAQTAQPDLPGDVQGTSKQNSIQGVSTSTPGSESDIESFVRQATITGVGTFSLDGIAWSSDRPFALINGQVVGPGGYVDGATLANVAQDRVTLERDGRRFELTLR